MTGEKLSYKERQQLEVSFTKNIDYIIDHLVKTDFSEYDIEVFTETVKTFLKFFDLRQYVLTSLYDKVKEIYSVVKPGDITSAQSYRKLLSIMLRISDEELTDALETFLAKDKDPNYFLVFLEEEVKQGVKLDNSIALFTSLMDIHQYDLKAINRFLSIIGKDHVFLSQILIKDRRYQHLRTFIRKAVEEDVSILDAIVPVIIKDFAGGLDHYFGLVSEIIIGSERFMHDLMYLHGVLMVDEFIKFVIANYSRSPTIIYRTHNYLWDKCQEKADNFESELLKKADSAVIVAYAIEVKNSNKRKVLKRLVEMRRDNNRHEANLVEFIKHFPEYSALLPML